MTAKEILWGDIQAVSGTLMPEKMDGEHTKMVYKSWLNIEKALTAYEQLERDVARYFELTYRGKWDNDLTIKEDNERRELFSKLSNLNRYEVSK